MTPRDVQDYEAQAKTLLRAVLDAPPRTDRVGMIAAALRAAGRAALERALAEVPSSQPDTRDRIRALIAPAPESPPAKVNACQVDLRTDKDRECFEDVVQAATRILRAEPPAPSTSQAAPTEPQPEPPYWRNGRHYGIHVYRGDTPIATFHTVEAAQAAVRAYNASLDRSAPAPDLAAQLDELSNALASHADAETGAKWDRLRAAVGARDQRIAELEAAVRWALGEEPLKDGRWFDYRAFGHKDNAAPPYWWRSILHLYSGLPDAPAPSKEPPP